MVEEVVVCGCVGGGCMCVVGCGGGWSCLLVWCGCVVGGWGGRWSMRVMGRWWWCVWAWVDRERWVRVCMLRGWLLVVGAGSGT